jgi:microcystin-dependent protein
MEGYVGEIRHFAANFAPRNWAFCMGQIVAIQSNTALFSLIGTTYGGNGSSTFQLPNLGGRVAVGVGQGPGLSDYFLGEIGGVNAVSLNSTQLPPHTHTSVATVTVPSYGDDGDVSTPDGNTLAAKPKMYSTQAGDDSMKEISFNVSTSIAGQGQPISVTQPTIGMNYIICLVGIFPARS